MLLLLLMMMLLLLLQLHVLLLQLLQLEFQVRLLQLPLQLLNLLGLGQNHLIVGGQLNSGCLVRMLQRVLVKLVLADLCLLQQLLLELLQRLQLLELQEGGWRRKLGEEKHREMRQRETFDQKGQTNPSTNSKEIW